jgi:hypothetical protein
MPMQRKARNVPFEGKAQTLQGKANAFARQEKFLCKARHVSFQGNERQLPLRGRAIKTREGMVFTRSR